MNQLMVSTTGTITSLDLVKEINLFRAEIEGKSEILHKNLLEIIRDEFKDKIDRLEIQPIFFTDKMNRKQPMFNLTISQAKQVLVRESCVVRSAVIHRLEELEKEVKQAKELTEDEIIVRAMATLTMRIENAKRETAERVAYKNSRLQIVGGTLGGTKKSLNTTKKKLQDVYHSRNVPTPDEWEALQRDLRRAEKENKRLRREVNILSDE